MILADSPSALSVGRRRLLSEREPVSRSTLVYDLLGCTFWLFVDENVCAGFMSIVTIYWRLWFSLWMNINCGIAHLYEWFLLFYIIWHQMHCLVCLDDYLEQFSNCNLYYSIVDYKLLQMSGGESCTHVERQLVLWSFSCTPSQLQRS